MTEGKPGLKIQLPNLKELSFVLNSLKQILGNDLFKNGIDPQKIISNPKFFLRTFPVQTRIFFEYVRFVRNNKIIPETKKMEWKNLLFRNKDRVFPLSKLSANLESKDTSPTAFLRERTAQILSVRPDLSFGKDLSPQFISRFLAKCRELAKATGRRYEFVGRRRTECDVSVLTETLDKYLKDEYK